MSLSSARNLLTSVRTRLSRDYLNKSFKLLRASSARIITTTMTIDANKQEPQTGGANHENGMPKSVYVQHAQSSDMMTISFEYKFNGQTKSFNLYRKASEPLSASLQRLKLNLAKYGQNKKIKRDKPEGDTSEPVSQVELYLNDTAINPDEATNVDSWVEGAVMKLNGESYIIKRNQPQVTVMKLPSIIMAGCITVPSLELFNCDIKDCEFNWYRRISAQEHSSLSTDPSLAGKMSQDSGDKSYWLHLATGLTYSPTDDDIAHHLKVVCSPRSGEKWGLNHSSISLKQVLLNPPTCPFEKRHAHTPEPLPSGDRIRVVSYNILADLYADQDYSRNVLFAHCPTHALDFDYRRQLLLKEIHGFNADILCLQEVDRKEFNKTFEPFFKLVTQHTGVHNTKGPVAEGVATFFRDDRFELIETHTTSLSKLIDPFADVEPSDEVDEAIVLSSVDSQQPKAPDTTATPGTIKTDSHPILSDPTSESAKNLLAKMDKIRSRIQSNENLRSRFMNRHTVLQTTLLRFRDKPDTFVIVANTHLYFAPDADHIRLLQGSVIVKYLEFIKDYYRKLVQKDKIDNPHISIIFCGDMNSTPDCGLYKLVQKGHVGENLNDWKSNEEQTVTGLSVDTDLRFLSSYKDIPYTNYTPGFNGCLDYIYYEVEGFECESTVPLADHEDVIATGGIPSDVFPSDHLALIANLRFKN